MTWWALIPMAAMLGSGSNGERIETLKRGLREFDEAARIGAHDPGASQRGYEAARRDFEALIDGGVQNGRLLYNLGNTWMRLGKTGKAIVCYRRAEQLIPGDANLDENLRFARSLRVDDMQPAASRAVVQNIFFWHYKTTLRSRAAAGVVCYVLFWVLMAARLFVRSRPPALLWTTRLAGVVAIALTISLTADLVNRGTYREGVFITGDVVLRKGNGESYDPQFDHRFSEGVEFMLIEPPREDWLHVQLPDGKDGWIRREQAELI